MCFCFASSVGVGDRPGNHSRFHSATVIVFAMLEVERMSSRAMTVKKIRRFIVVAVWDNDRSWVNLNPRDMKIKAALATPWNIIRQEEQRTIAI